MEYYILYIVCSNCRDVNLHSKRLYGRDELHLLHCVFMDIHLAYQFSSLAHTLLYNILKDPFSCRLSADYTKLIVCLSRVYFKQFEYKLLLLFWFSPLSSVLAKICALFSFT